MKIRPATLDDAETIARAEDETAAAQEGLLASAPGEIPVEAHRARIAALSADDHGLYVVLEDEGRIVGHLLLQPLGFAAVRHVVDLKIVVHPGCTDRGYGRRLMEHAIDWSRRSPGVEKIELKVRATNARAIHLYESLGFETEGRLARRFKLASGYVDDVCMALVLAR